MYGSWTFESNQKDGISFHPGDVGIFPKHQKFLLGGL
jgi:hypothetical protein